MKSKASHRGGTQTALILAKTEKQRYNRKEVLNGKREVQHNGLNGITQVYARNTEITG